MSRNRRHSLPQMRLHSRTGHARVRINGTEHWLGRFGSPEAQAAYDRLIAEYLIQRSGGRQAEPAKAPPVEELGQPAMQADGQEDCPQPAIPAVGSP